MIFVILLVSASVLSAKKVRILVAYYSVSGHTEQMAQAVQAGALQIDSVDVILALVDSVSKQQVLQADAIIVGSPVYNANTAPAVQSFINRWPFADSPLKNKIGAAFVSAGGFSAGEELVQLNILHSMLIYNMIVVGGEDWRSAFGASAVVSEGEYKRGAVHEIFLKKAQGLGRRVAEITMRMHGN